MQLYMKAVLWDALQLDDEHNYRLALCCFYLGRGVEEVRDLISRRKDDPEVKYVLSTAMFAGINFDLDVIRKT